MKRSWDWMLAWIVVVCLLWSLGLQTSMNPAGSFEKHLVDRPKESPSPAHCQSRQVLSGGWIHSRAGPQNLFFSPDVSLRAEDQHPEGPPWLESRGPPGKYRDPGPPCRAESRESRDGSPHRGGKLCSHPQFSGGRPPEFEIRGFATRFSYS